MKTVTVTMGTQGVKSLTVGGGENLILQANAPPQLVQAVTVDSAGCRHSEVTTSAPVVSGNTVTQTYPWGVMETTYSGGRKLTITVTVTNTGTDCIDHLWWYPLGLNLPCEPVNYNPSCCATFNLDAPSSIWWNLGADGTVDLVNEDAIKPLCLAWWKATSATPLTKHYVSLNTDSGQTVSSNWPPTPRPIPPGICDTYTISLRFGPAGATDQQLAGDIYARYACAFPKTVRVPLPNQSVAAINMTSARFVNNVRTPYPTNPRGWWNSPDIDVTTQEGVAAFQSMFLGSAAGTIGEIKRVGAMGAIFWDLEGQEFDAAYIGDPCQIEALAPELCGVIDEFLAQFRDAGVQIGFCVRPQVFCLADQTQTNVDDMYTVMYDKMRYACDRWGATMFYIDSNLNYEGVLNPAEVFARLAAALPEDVLLFPEWEATKYYAYTIPYNNALNNLFGAPESALKVYRDAVGLVKVTDPAAAQYKAEITAAAHAGNMLLFDGWYPHPANDLVKQIYEDMD